MAAAVLCLAAVWLAPIVFLPELLTESVRLFESNT